MKPNVKSLDSRLDLPPEHPFESNCGHKIPDFVLSFISILLLLKI